MVALRVSNSADDIGFSVYGYPVSSRACLVMFAFICTWACDTGAFFTGKAFGKHKIAPVLSPNKTYEGSLGGLVFTMLIALGAGYIIKLPWHHSIIMGALFGILSQVGDLSESAIKREIGIKDFGSVVPGHGGFLDRIDSMLFTAPAAYYYCVLFLQNWPK